MINMDVELVAAAAIVYVTLKKEKETKEETRNMDKTKLLILNSDANFHKAAFRSIAILQFGTNLYIVPYPS